MSLIKQVASIIDNKLDLDDVKYYKEQYSYDDNISILDIKLEDIVPPPPTNSSLTTSKELKTVVEAAKTRTNLEVDLVLTADEEPLTLFYKFLRTKDLTFPKDKFDQYYNIIEQYMYALKFYHNRPRPEQLAPYYNLEVEVLRTETHHTPSYPSGHTMYSELAYHILKDQYPIYEKNFKKLSEYCGFARILQGVHFPSDNRAAVVAMSKLYPLIKEKLNDESKRAEKETLDRSTTQ